MEIKVNIKLVNSDFSQSIAEDFYNGEESDENVKYNWEDELIIRDVENFSIQNNETYTLQYEWQKKTINHEVPRCTILNCSKGNITTQLIFSRAIIKSTNKINNEAGDVLFEIYLKDTLGFYNPIDGIYISKEYFPKELQNTTELLGITDEQEEE